MSCGFELDAYGLRKPAGSVITASEAEQRMLRRMFRVLTGMMDSISTQEFVSRLVQVTPVPIPGALLVVSLSCAFQSLSLPDLDGCQPGHDRRGAVTARPRV